MAMQTVAQPSAQVVGNTFVEQYYQIQHHSPESVYRFYQDSSVLSRPDANGVMTSVTTMKVSISRINLFTFMIRNVLEGVGQAELSFKSNDLSVIDPKTKPKTLEVFDDQVFHLLTHAYFLYESIFLYFFFWSVEENTNGIRRNRHSCLFHPTMRLNFFRFHHQF